jgi:hypothetical protein
MLNTLANHGFLPHSGQNFTREITASALGRALYINESLSNFLFENAVRTNPAPNATTFSLETLRAHNVLEHDASLRSVCLHYHPLSHPLGHPNLYLWDIPLTE